MKNITIQKKVFGLKRKATGATLVIIRRTNTAHKYYSSATECHQSLLIVSPCRLNEKKNYYIASLRRQDYPLLSNNKRSKPHPWIQDPYKVDAKLPTPNTAYNANLPAKLHKQ